MVVVTHRGGPLLARCVAALAPQLVPGDRLVVVVSAGRGRVQVPPPALRVEAGRNVGYARAANLGLAGAFEDLCVVLNDDTEPLGDFLEALRAAAAEGPALLQPRILLDDGSGRLDNAGHRLWPDGYNLARGRGQPDGPAWDRPSTVGACSGAALGIHREVLERVGPFDPALVAFGEDADLSLRAVRAGYPCRYVPGARVRHRLGATYGRVGLRKIALVERNRVRLALRSLPRGWVLPGLPATLLRWAAMGLAAGAGRGPGAGAPRGAALAAVGGALLGWAGMPAALRRRRRDRARWRLDDAGMCRHLREHRVRLSDLLG